MVLAALLVFLALRLWRRRRPNQAPSALLSPQRQQAIQLLQREQQGLWQLLATHGYPRSPQETAREFLAKISSPILQAMLLQMITTYEEARFGGVNTPAHQQERQAQLVQLATWLAANPKREVL